MVVACCDGRKRKLKCSECMSKSLLIVDDEPVWRMAVGTFLKLKGYQVLTAKNAKEALVQAEAGELAAVILDVCLPGEDSARLLRHLKAEQPHAQIILYTGLDENQDAVQQMLKQGAEHHFRKGNLNELRDCLREIWLQSREREASGELVPVPA